MTDLPLWYHRLRSRYLSGPPIVMLDRFFNETYDFPRVAVKPSVYLIAATPRCGSHYLGHLLFATKQLGAPLEYLNLYSYRRWSQIVGSKQPETVLREIMARRTSPTGWFGLQAHWFQMTFAGINISRDALDIRRIIWIRRRDTIEQAVSLAIVLQNGAWTSFHKPSEEPVYDYQAIADCLEGIGEMETAWMQFLTETHTPHLSLFYEDIRADERAAVTHILDWFGLPPVEISSAIPLRKQANEINAEWKERFLREMLRQ